MIGGSLTVGTGRFVSGQRDLLFLPANRVRGRRLTVLLHGQLQGDNYPVTFGWNDPNGAEFTAAPKQAALFWTLAGAGIPLLAIYDDGAAWGNDAGVADLEAVRTGAGSIGCATDKLVLLGISMGALDAFNYAATYPSHVAALAGLMPAADTDDIRDNNRGGNTRVTINAAWSSAVSGGLVGSDTSATKALPTRANPSNTANAAAIGTSGPTQLYFSTADTVVIPSTVTTLAARIGSNCTTTVVSTTLDHSDPLVGAAPAAAIAQFIDAHL